MVKKTGGCRASFLKTMTLNFSLGTYASLNVVAVRAALLFICLLCISHIEGAVDLSLSLTGVTEPVLAHIS